MIEKIPAAINGVHYMVKPSCHGNGGWCGSTTIKTFKSLDEALAYDPSTEYDEEHCSGYWGDDNFRICTDENPNHALYIYEFDDLKWNSTNAVIENGKTQFDVKRIRDAINVISKFNQADFTDIELVLNGKVVEIPVKFAEQFGYAGLANKDMIAMFLMKNNTLPKDLQQEE